MSIDPEAVAREYRYEKLTWPEINVAIEQQKVVVLPVGSVEQHGHHLPLDVDFRTVTSICLAAGERSPADMLVMPPVNFGYCHHVMDFPGTINIEPETFIRFLLDITRSVAYHGFKKIIVINGHGSNMPLVEQVGRQTNLQTSSLCCTLGWWHLVTDLWNEIRDSGPGGSAHACELETSVYLHMDRQGVRTDRINGAMPEFMTDIPGGDEWQKVDLTLGTGPASIISWTSTYSETGSFGAPELATAEKGERVFEHAADRLVALVQWLRNRPIEPRREHHARETGVWPPFGF